MAGLKRAEIFQNLPGIAAVTAGQMTFASDSIFASIACDHLDYCRDTLLQLCARFNKLLAGEAMFYVRGAIVAGPVFHKQGIIVGPGVVSAVETERQTLFPRIVIQDSALGLLGDAYRDYAETQWLYRGADGVASLNTIDIGYGSDAKSIVHLARRTLERIAGRLVAAGRDAKLAAKHLWMRAYCEYLVHENLTEAG